MVCMTALPKAAWTYALQAVLTAALLAAAYRALKIRLRADGIVAGLLVGAVVFFVWIAPEPWLWPTKAIADGEAAASPYLPEVCGWTLTLTKLAASAFVISAAEELFFRKWLVEFAGFGWMIVLFAVEHMRFDLGIARGCVFIAEGAFAGLAYGWLARKHGLLSAIIAHALTNLVLGLYVVFFNKWFYW